MIRRLNRREQVLIAVCAGVLGIWALWSLALSPLLEERRDALARIAKANAIADILVAAPAATVRQTDPRLPLRARITARAERDGLSIRRLEPSGDALIVTLDDVAFTTAIGWLDALTGSDGLSIAAIEMARLVTPGRANLRVTLEQVR